METEILMRLLEKYDMWGQNYITFYENIKSHLYCGNFYTPFLAVLCKYAFLNIEEKEENNLKNILDTLDIDQIQDFFIKEKNFGLAIIKNAFNYIDEFGIITKDNSASKWDVEQKRTIYDLNSFLRNIVLLTYESYLDFGYDEKLAIEFIIGNIITNYYPLEIVEECFKKYKLPLNYQILLNQLIISDLYEFTSSYYYNTFDNDSLKTKLLFLLNELNHIISEKNYSLENIKPDNRQDMMSILLDYYKSRNQVVMENVRAFLTQKDIEVIKNINPFYKIDYLAFELKKIN